ncbi:hypothetical protein [Caulobacter endophyticus]|uniref:hypothetical protein n=1 Tax=Caulobacter endophyticus TaxID=2172652 RepID=UPI0013049C4F|nr:hypothetical protein [Caulobacter endophyticus]
MAVTPNRKRGPFQVKRIFTTLDAAAISGLELKIVQNLIDKKVVILERSGGGRRSPRFLSRHHLLCLRLDYYLTSNLSVPKRARLYRELEERPGLENYSVNPVVHLDVAWVRRDVDARIADLDEAISTLGANRQDPTFPHTQIKVYDTVRLLELGLDPQDIISEYTLTERQLYLARLWVVAHPHKN